MSLYLFASWFFATMHRLSWYASLLLSGSVVLQGTLAQAQQAPTTPLSELLQYPSILEIDPASVSPETAPSVMPMHLVLELGRRRVSLYQGDTLVKSYPVAIGRAGWETPTGSFKVEQMVQDPPWMNFRTRAVIPGGDPRNPMGRHWIGFWTDGNNWIGFHGTNRPDSIGQAISHGCVRMQNLDITELFSQVEVGVPVLVRP